MQQHSQEFGQNCLACHDGDDRMTKLDHQLTKFPLTGLHLEVRCVECHKVNAAEPGIRLTNTESGKPLSEKDPFKSTPTECSLCHAEPQMHKGIFAGSCDQCHSTAGWSPALLEGKEFEHTASSGFSLVEHSVDYSDRQMVCMDCHGSDLATVDQKVCISCHTTPEGGIAFMTEHLAQFGGNCLQCHDGADRMSNFDHALFFPLDGHHLEAECSQCHQNQVFAGTPSECVQCHGEPAIHMGFFGVKCQYCHTAQAWTPAQLRMHTFPLDHGGQGEIACQTCHPGTYPETTCFGCHDHQLEPIKESHLQGGIPEDEIMLCAECHPIGIIEASQ